MIDYKATRELLRKTMFGTYHPKTVRQVFVRNPNGRDYYRTQPVNIEQINQVVRGTPKVEQPKDSGNSVTAPKVNTNAPKVEQTDTKVEKPAPKKVAAQPKKPAKPVAPSKEESIAQPKIKYKSGFTPSDAQKKNIDAVVKHFSEGMKNFKSSLQKTLEDYRVVIERDSKIYDKENWKQSADAQMAGLKKLFDNLEITQFTVKNCNSTKVTFSFKTNIPTSSYAPETEGLLAPSRIFSELIVPTVLDNCIENPKDLKDKDYPYNKPTMELNFVVKHSDLMEDVPELKSAEVDKIMSNSTPQQQSLYKTTGVCATDKGAEGFIKNRLLKDVKNPENAIRTRISTASKDEHDKISRLIEETWEKDEERRNKMQREGWSYKIHGIYKIDEMVGEESFEAIKKKNKKFSKDIHGGKNAALDTFFHGSTFTNSQKILGSSGGFKILEDADTGSMLGRAIYLASNSSKSAEYIDNHGGFFVCEASLGNCLDIEGMPDYWDESVEQDIKSEYGAIFADALIGGPQNLFQPEFAVYNEKAVRPRYIVDMELVKE